MCAHPLAGDAEALDQEGQYYEIRVRGHLGETLLVAFPDLRAHAHGGETVLAGRLPDQAALHGVLAQIGTLALELLEVTVYCKVQRATRISRIGRRRLILLDGSLDLTNTERSRSS